MIDKSRILYLYKRYIYCKYITWYISFVALGYFELLFGFCCFSNTALFVDLFQFPLPSIVNTHSLLIEAHQVVFSHISTFGNFDASLMTWISSPLAHLSPVSWLKLPASHAELPNCVLQSLAHVSLPPILLSHSSLKLSYVGFLLALRWSSSSQVGSKGSYILLSFSSFSFCHT